MLQRSAHAWLMMVIWAPKNKGQEQEQGTSGNDKKRGTSDSMKCLILHILYILCNEEGDTMLHKSICYQCMKCLCSAVRLFFRIWAESYCSCKDRKGNEIMHTSD